MLANAPASMPEARDPLVGSVINGKFHILQAIARGGMGRIYYATQAPLDRPVALKVVRADTANEEQANFLKRFLLEASILAKLQHPNVVTLFDYGRIESGGAGGGEQYFIAMEYLAGETLSARLKQRQILSTPEVLFLIRQIGRGLREAHSRGIVHRDLKPSNILLVPEADGGELVKIVDFGIGKVVAAEDVTKDLTQDGMMVGTPRYMAPEQFEGTASPASDIYALGTIVYQALAGALPFNGATLPEFMVAKFAHDIPPIRSVNPQAYLPDSLEQLVLRMLARQPDARPSLDELFSQLSYCEQEVFGHAQSGPSSLTGPRALGASGTGPRLPARLSEPSRVPPTIVAPLPLPGFPSGTMGGLTPRPMSTSMRPPPKPGNGRIVVAALVLLGLGGVGAGAWALKSSRERSAASASTTTSGTPVPMDTVPPTPASAEPSFTFALDSSPSGAAVFEGEKQIGVTPIQIPIERASVRAQPRMFVLKKDGFVSANVPQGLSDESTVKQMVTLAPDPQASKPRPHTGPTGGGTKPAGARPGGGDDIRLNR